MSHYSKPLYLSGYEEKYYRDVAISKERKATFGYTGYIHRWELYDCTGHVIYASGILTEFPIAFSYDGQTSCKTRFWIKISIGYSSNSSLLWGNSARIRVPVLPQKGRIVFTFPVNGIPSWADTLENLRIGVMSKRRSLLTGPFSSKKTLRPSPESFNQFRLSGQYVVNGGVVTTNTVTTIPYTAFTRTWSGVRTPNFGKLKAKGQLPVNNHSVSITRTEAHSEMRFEYGFNAVTQKPFTEQNFTAWGGPALPAFTFNSKVVDIALKRVIGRAGGGLANIAQDIAQLGQLNRLIGGTAYRLAAALLQLRKLNLPGAVRTLFGDGKPRYNPRFKPSLSRDVASNWLALQYGWKPLLMTIHGSLEALARYQYETSDVVRSVTASATLSNVQKGLVKDNAAVPVILGSWVDTQTSRCRFGLRYSISSPMVALLGRTGLTNPISLVWELIPFSFVVDWFLPIGPYLEQLQAWDGLTFQGGYKTRFLRRDYVGVTDFSGQTTAQLGSDRYMIWKGSRVQYDIALIREKLITFPSPQLPQLKSGLSVSHALNGLALLRVLFR